MSYKTIMVCLTNLATTEKLTKAACVVARKFDAHLIGLHAIQTMEIYQGVDPYMSVDLAHSFDAAQKAEAEKIQALFENITAPEDFVAEWRCVKASTLEAVHRMVEDARCADLIIMAQPDPNHDHDDERHFQRDIIEGSGRPVLVIPHSGDFQTFGQNVLIGWSATKEASRAVHDAIPFMRDGGKATVFWISKTGRKDSLIESTGREMAICLDRHAIKAAILHRLPSKLPIGDEILNEAADQGADMIVAGAYGHSRLYDFLLGATTPHLMRHMTVPVLFSC